MPKTLIGANELSVSNNIKEEEEPIKIAYDQYYL
jgi:hypothetical protein